MKFVLLLLCLIGTVCYSFAAVALEPANKDKNHPGHCYTETHGLGEFKKGEERGIPGQCGKASCLDNGDIQYVSCGAIAVAPPCKLGKVDLSKPYPDCCPQPVCN